MRSPQARELREWSRLEAMARQNRSQLTPSEARLWVALRGGALGVVFRRQVVIGRYIADFASQGARVVVEVDGAWHRERATADARRDRALGRAGWRVVRVTAEDVTARMDDVLCSG